MKAATSSKRFFEETKLLVIHEGGKTTEHSHVGQLADYFSAGDLLVVNRSGTMPSSFFGEIEGRGEALEIRLASFLGTDTTDYRHWRAVVFGGGNWRIPTENRGEAPVLRRGDRIWISPELSAIVRAVDWKFPRLIEIEFSSVNLMKALYQAGNPIQYSYLQEKLAVWDQQTLFSGPPLSVEPPSAAFQLNWQMMFALQKRGVGIATLLHGAGLSSTGDAKFDAIFPLDEFYEIPEETIRLVAETRQRGGKVIALGTTVTRALETAFRDPQSIVTSGRTTLHLSAATPLRVTDTLLTGMHEEGTSHLGLMEAFGGGSKLLDALQKESVTYRSHEYGDLTLLERAMP